MFLRNFIATHITTNGVIKSLELLLAFWGCVIASRGLNTWKKQLLEAPKIDLARRIVEQFYNMRDLIGYARSNFISYNPDEVRKFYNEANLTPPQCSLGYRLMIFDKSIDEIQTFQKLCNKAKVLYSQEIEDCFLEVIKIIANIQNACRTIISLTNNDKGLNEDDGDFIKELKEKIYEQADNDTINTKLQNIINEVEYNLKPIYEESTIKWKKINTKPRTIDNL